MPSIRPLPEDVRSSLRSGIFLFDLTRVVEELVFNSLDAVATKISVFVSVRSCYIKVVDDGVGIIERDRCWLEKDTVCTLSIHHRFSFFFTSTSKLLSLADLNDTSGSFGFRGEALASISEVSLLEIWTRTFGRANGYTEVLKGCKCLYLGIDDDRKEVGTTVVVRDLFHNQLVRRKYMQSSPKKVLQSVKKCMLRLALVRPNILFKVVDIESGFGVEVSSSLHELQDQDDVIKLSEYISGPCNSFTLKRHFKMTQYLEEVINPSLKDNSLLYLQPQHILEHVWNNNVNRILHIKRVMHTNQMIDPPYQIIEYLRLFEFYGVPQVRQFNYD